MADEGMELRTTLTVAQVATIFHDTMVDINRRVEFGDVERSSSPFARFDDQPQFTAHASIVGKVNPINNWALQIYVFDNVDFRRVQLVIVGSSFGGRAMRGAKYTFSKRVGRQQAERVHEQLQSADPSLRMIA